MNKKFYIGIFISVLFSLNCVSAQQVDGDNSEISVQNDVLMISETDAADSGEEAKTIHGGIGVVPAKKRPAAADEEKLKAAREKDENSETEEKNRKTLKYGLPSEISTLLDDLIENEDPRYEDDIYDLFWEAKNSTVKQKVLDYFAKLEDPCLEDYAVDLLNDPYDEKKEVVNSTFKYVQAVKTKEALPPVLNIVESENEDYFNGALETLGEIGGEDEAKFIAEFLNRDDLTDAQRQILMRTLGKMHAQNTWNQVVEILENEDENSYVRMYAAEALGLMEKEESVPVLVRNYSATDPNLRQYVIKGLSHFPDVVEARATIVQAIRDEHWRVRQEAIKTSQDKNFTEAVPYLIYRAENDSEKVIKNNSYEAIAAINTEEGNNFLIKQLTDKKTGDSTKQKVVEVLLKEGHAGEKEILELADSIVNDDKRKTLRYAVGKELAKKSKPEYAEICEKFLESKDATTVSLGIDMYKNCKFASVEPKLREIAKDKKANASNKARIKKMLGIEDEEDSDSKTEKKSTEIKTSVDNSNAK